MLDEVKDFKGAYDQPSPNDFKAQHILGAPLVLVQNLPKKVNMNDLVPSDNQGASLHCTAYGLTHIHRILNSIEFAIQISMNPEEQWGNQCTVKGIPVNSYVGDSLQNALNALSKFGLKNVENSKGPKVFQITGFADISHDVTTAKQWLASQMPIYTGWKDHCFALVGYSDENQCFIAKNSYGPKWGIKGDGTFDISYSDLAKLFTFYIIYDKPDLPMIFKDVSENSAMAPQIKRIRDLGLMKGYGDSENFEERFFRPEQQITRAEQAVLTSNFLDLLEKKLGIKF